MPSRYRLSRADFAHTRRLARETGRFFMFSYGTVPNRTFPGVACVISGKIAKNAVRRNRLRRRVRAILLPFCAGASAPTVFVLMAKKGAAEASFEEIQADIESFLKRKHLFS